MATPTIKNGEEHFFPVIYEGNGGGQRVGKFVAFDDSSGGTIANSCIFNRGDNPKLSRLPSSDGNRRTLTYSVWIKRGILGTENHFISCYDGSSTDNESMWEMQFLTDNTVSISRYSDYILQTTRTFEDTSKWYHFVMAIDTTQGTASDRVKLYVDGDEITTFDVDNRSNITQNFDTAFNNTSDTCVIGARINNTTKHWSGYMAEINLVDGQALTPASFGLTDTSTGRWIPSVVKPYPTTTTTFTVTVADASGNKYFIDSSQQATVTLIEGATYRFDQSDSSNAGHPLRFSTTSNGTHGGGTEFTSGVTTAGTPGSSGAYTEITVPVGTATLYYYCTNHSGMGGQANTQDQYGTNGFRLQFQDSSALGDDTSGKTNDFSVTNIVASDQTTDSPTQNFATLSTTRVRGTIILSEGNLKIESGATSYACSATTLKFSETASQGLYFEAKSVGSLNDSVSVLLMRDTVNVSGLGNNQQFADCFGLQSRGGGGGNTYWTAEDGANGYDTGVSHSSNDYIQVAFKEGKVWFGINNTWIGSGNPATGANPTYNNIAGQDFRFLITVYQNNALELNFGQKSFNYTPPTGFVAVQQDNLPETAKGITGMSWTKDRDSGSYNHELYDSSRGAFQEIRPNATTAENTRPQALSKFLKGGFAVGDRTGMNSAGNSYVSWNWVANSGTTGSSTNSTVQVNSTSKFSIVQYNGTGSDQTIGHGLGVKPDTIWVKCVTENSATGTGVSWRIWQKDVISLSGDANSYLRFDSDDSQSAGGDSWGDTAPTSSVFTVGADVNTNASVSGGTAQYVAYCFANVDGYFKTGKYVGNSSSDGSFIYLGFKPAFLMVKAYNLGSDFQIWDNVRSPINPITNTALFPNLTNAEGGTHTLDLLSNGFKLRSTENWVNSSSYTYVYWAFAEHPFVGDGVSPVTAR